MKNLTTIILILITFDLVGQVTISSNTWASSTDYIG